TAQDKQNKTGAWDSNYVSVYHLPNGASLSAADSTGLNSAVNHGAVATTGQIDGAAIFNGSSQYISAALATSASTNVTMSAWVKWNGTSQESVIAQNGASGTGWGLRIGGSGGGCGSTGGSVTLLLSGITCNALSST